jgi:DnaK suppressor protein
MTARPASRSPGNATLCPMDEAHARELLARQRERIERALTELARNNRDDDELSHLDQHPADEATELFDDELDEGLAERLRTELAAVKRAEERLEQGTYGLSIESGEPIPDARLEAVPWAERTADEQERYEHRG